MLKLNLCQNALHTLHHAIEHLRTSERDPSDERGGQFNPDDRSVSWRDRDGHLCFVIPEFTRLPVAYDLKFALLHLIQASELLLKTYVEKCDPAALFCRPRFTITLEEALRLTTMRNAALLNPSEVALLLEAKRLRNAIEHYTFDIDEKRLRAICVDFLTVCMLLAQALLSINIIEAFDWDHLHDRPDPVGDYLRAALGSLSEAGLATARRTGEHWVRENSSQPAFLCLNCGTRAVSRDSGACMGCGCEGNEEIVELLQEWETFERQLNQR